MMRSAVFTLLLCIGCDRAQEPAPPEPPKAVTSAFTIPIALQESGRVQVVAVERRAPNDSLSVPGLAVASEEGSGEVTTLVAGRVASLEVKDGASVARGQVLAWIDAPAATVAMAEVLRARGKRAQTEKLLRRQEQLAQEDATSQSALDDARASDIAAAADLLAARTLLRSYGGREPGADATSVNPRVAVRSPIDGVLTERMTTLGSPVSPERPLFRVVAPTQIYVRAKLPELAGDAPGTGTAVTLWPRQAGSEAGCKGTIVSAVDVVDAEQRRALRVEPDRPCPGLRIGGYVDVELARTGAGAPALIVPRRAVLEVKGVEVVFVQRGADSFESIPLRIGARTGTEVVVDELESRLQAGDRVVSVGAVLLKGEMLRAELGE